MEITDQAQRPTGVAHWPEDDILSDQAFERLKEAAEHGCLLCSLDDLGEDE